MQQVEIKTLAERLINAAHIYQEIGGDLDAVAEQVKAIVSELPYGHLRGWLNSWATSCDARDERDAYSAIASFAIGLHLASLDLDMN